MSEIGQCGQAWPDRHLGPEQAVRANQLVKGRVMLPVHWGLFTLAYHGWTEPIERARVARLAVEDRRTGPDRRNENAVGGQDGYSPQASPEF